MTTIKCLFLFLLCVCPGLLQASDETVWPQKGLVALWDFTQDPKKDLVGNRKIFYKSRYYKPTRDYSVDTLANGRIGLATDATLPFTLQNSPDTITLVLTYAPEDEDVDELDEELLRMGRLGYFTADDGVMECGGYMSTAYETFIQYTIPMKCDKDGYVRLIFSLYGLPSDEEKPGVFHYAQGISASGEQHWSYQWRNLQAIDYSRDKNKKDSISVFAPANLLEVALYDRLLTEEEQTVLMGTKRVKVFQPDSDHSRMDWRWPFPVAMMIWVIVQGVKQWRKRYKPVSRQWIMNHYPQQADCLEKAKEHVRLAWWVFGSPDAPKYPKTDEEMDRVVRELDAAIATGCVDDEMVTEYNKLSALVNHCRQYTCTNRFAFMMAMFLLVLAALEPLTDYNFIDYTMKSRAFYIYYLTALATIVCGFAERYRGYYGQPIPRATRIMSAMVKAATVVGQAGLVVGTTVVGLVTAFLGMLVLWLRIALSFIVEFAIVVVKTGAVVATGVTGLTAGLVVGGILMFILAWLAYYVFIAILWCLVFALPIGSYYMARNIGKW